NVESRETIRMTEDIIFESYLDQYIKSPNVEYELYSSEHISFEPRVLPDFTVNGVLTPELNWFGSEIIALQTFSEPLFIPLPPPVPIIVAVPPIVIPPVPPTPILKYTVEYGYFEFDVNVVGVNDPPIVNTEDLYYIRMTTDTTFDLSQPFDLNTFFDDVDSSMWFSWDTLNGLVTLEMEENKLWSMTASGVVGEDIIYIIANDEEYTTSYEIAFDVEPRQTIPMMEDFAYQWELDNYINMSSQEYELIGSEHVSVETEVQPDETVIGTFSPDNDWFGSETINLWTYPEPYSIIPPPIDPVIMSAPPVGVIPPPIIQTIKEYGYFEFEVNVESVNDAPVMFEVPQIVLDEDNTLYEAFNIEDYFDDIDSLLVYEISTQNSKITALMGSDGSVDIIPDENWFGTESIVISASDEEYMLSQEVGIQVLPVNDPPYVSGEAATITFDEDSNSTIDLTGYIEDIDSALWFSYLCDSENVSFELNETTWELCAVPDENWFGVLDLVIYGSDNECQLARNLTINVTPVNDPPELLGYEDVYLSEDTTTTIDVAAMFTDIDSELSLMAYSGSGMLSTEFTTSSMVELRPNIPNWYGDETLTVVATDGEYSVSFEVPIHVEPINDCPVLTFSTLEYDIMEDSKLSLIVEKMFDDVDGDVLTYSFDAPEELNAQYDEDKGLLTLIPVKDWYGTAKVSITVSDDSESANTELRLVVSPINDAPFQTGSIAMMVMNTSENRTINLADYFEDIEHEQLFFEVTAAVNLTVTAINRQGLFQIGAKNNWSGAENLVFTVSDGIDTIEIEVPVYVTSSPESTVESSLTSESNIFRSISLISLMLLAVAVAFFVLQGQGRRHGKARRTATNRDLII
ncbi:MAG: tandem-95 repeat protein, partial [Thermoplasmata archaeon]|nr:tandem-95 repeat protein [Thermoplasmata archaeon]